jgi:hypothetical protein
LTINRDEAADVPAETLQGFGLLKGTETWRSNPRCAPQMASPFCRALRLLSRGIVGMACFERFCALTESHRPLIHR